MVCDYCHVHLTVEHVLVDCIKCITTRLHYGMKDNIRALLDDDADRTCHGFFKEKQFIIRNLFSSTLIVQHWVIVGKQF